MNAIQKAKVSRKTLVSASLDALNKEDIQAAVKDFSEKSRKGRKVSVAIPLDARCVLVSVGDDGQVMARPAGWGQSVLNIEQDIFSHLNEKPYTDEFLIELRDFCAAKLEARQMARKSGGLAIPVPKGRGFAIVSDFKLIRGNLEVTA